ncbi:MAG: hypothetical protein U0X91_31535 [Spirosomataceae bacterium]
MKYKIILFFLLQISCENSNENYNGIWIPETINWKEGNFETIYIENDTSFVKISSTNLLLRSDSIQFMTEPGFILSAGSIIKTDNKFLEAKYNIWYKFINLQGEKLPSKTIKETIKIEKKANMISLIYRNKIYLKTNKFSNESKIQLLNISNGFLENLKKKGSN